MTKATVVLLPHRWALEPYHLAFLLALGCLVGAIQCGLYLLRRRRRVCP